MRIIRILICILVKIVKVFIEITRPLILINLCKLTKKQLMRKFQELGMMLHITKSVIGDRSPSKTKSCLLDIIHSIRTRHFLVEHLLLHNFRINMEVQLTDRESIHSSVRLEIWSQVLRNKARIRNI